ncbi:molybdopterin-binding protein [Arcobacter sp. LA11]|uniref:TOBE domain-containing protein n=1 Tax=Arcobacter sp. LA11 TaxID=1898176 RepID=UPI0009353E89|nr:TOBE domain-containing protein [Arcobacter sp. LA11]
MTNLIATIKEIETIDSLNIVSFDFFGTPLTMMSLELKDEVQIGKKVILGIKPTTIAIAKNFSGEISYSNQIESAIQSIEIGKLLCSIKLISKGTTFESIITSKSAKKLDLKENDNVTAFIKASEISISKVLDD